VYLLIIYFTSLPVAFQAFPGILPVPFSDISMPALGIFDSAKPSLYSKIK